MSLPLARAETFTERQRASFFAAQSRPKAVDLISSLWDLVFCHPFVPIARRFAPRLPDDLRPDCQTICAPIARRFAQVFATTLKLHSLPLGKSSLSGHGTCLLRRVIFRASGLPRILRPWPSHNIRNPSPCLIGWLPSPKGAPSSFAKAPADKSSRGPVAMLRRRITERGVLGVRPREGI